MAKRVIEVHYHPAIKEVKFKTEDGKPFEPEQLKQWQYDKFILQEHGEDFFDSISEALDEADKIVLNFYGTHIDYEDFDKMVKFYNKSKNSNKFSCKPSGVLLSMNEMYLEAEKFGSNAVKKLKLKLKELDTAGGSNPIKEDFKKELKTFIGQIDSKINSLKSTGINICFVGTYSAGKSSLINAILGEKILPEEDESKTAKFYIINGLDAKESEGICFELDGDETLVKWNGTSLELTDKGGQSGSHPFRKAIMNCIIHNSTKVKHRQFYALLDLLNGAECVGVKISVVYPIPMNTPSMSFTIYDTPGTGSNSIKHKDVLEEAVKNQSHSIVVFVGGVTKLEGEGNSLLLQILSGDNQNSIDLDRSLYVINRSDTTTQSKLGKYQEETIRLKDSAEVEAAEDKKDVEAKITIPLKDKKLFFVSAAQGYAAKAKKANVADDDDEEFWEGLKKYPFYDFNRYGNSEAATERTRTAAQKAAEGADEYDRAYINVGLFSLVEAIKEYGEKYAMATKVNALVSTVEDIFNKLKRAAQTQEDMCNSKIEELQKDLDIIKGSITTAINKEHEKNIPKKNKGRWVLDESGRKSIGVDAHSIKQITDHIRNRVAEELRQMQNDKAVKTAKWWDNTLSSVIETNFANKAAERKLKAGVNNNCVDDKKIASALNEGLIQYIKGFNSLQVSAVGVKQGNFKKAVIDVIQKDGDLTQTAKDYLIQGLEKEQFDGSDMDDYSADVGEIVRECIDVKGKWIFTKEVVDTTKLLKEIKDLISEVLAAKTQEFTDSFCKNLEKVISDVKSNFEENAEGYSVRVQVIKKDQSQVSEIAEKTRKAAAELDVLIKDLINLIWRGIVNE